MGSLKQWYLNYINLFREKYEKLSADEKKYVNSDNNFLNPCQIEVFWIAEMNWQLIVQSNFNDRPDKEIIINGPYKSYEFHSKVIPVLEDKRWSRKVKRNSSHRYEQVNTLGEKMALEIYKFIEMSKNSAFMSSVKQSSAIMGYILDDVWVQINANNIGEFDYIKKINKVIQEIKQEAKIQQEPMPTLQEPIPIVNDTYTGFGVHLFPPIIIGQEQKRSMDELLHNRSNYRSNQKMFDMKIDNNQIIVNKDGFIFVENISKENTLKILNLIMSFGKFYGFSLHAVHEHELVMANYDKQDLTITGMQWNTGTRRAHLINGHFNPTYQSSAITRTKVRPDIMQEILSNTAKLLENKKLSEDMRLLNEGLTHFSNSEFAPSFIMGWSVIERHYSDLWYTLLSQRNLDQERISKLSNSNQWTIDYILEVLNLQDKIDENSYDLLMDLKRKRNKFYHNGKQIIKEDADKCLKYAARKLAEKIKPHLSSSQNMSDWENRTLR